MCLLVPALTQGNASTSSSKATSPKGGYATTGVEEGHCPLVLRGQPHVPWLQGTQRSQEARLALLWEGAPPFSCLPRAWWRQGGPVAWIPGL